MSIEWKTSTELVPYTDAIAFMEARVDAIIAGDAPELIWLLEHPPLYTAGTSAKDSDLLAHNGLPVHHTGRGGQFTYHGPGQRVAYIMLDLKRRNAMDVRAYVQSLEQWIIDTLKNFGVESFIREGRVGVWVNEEPSARKAECHVSNASCDSGRIIKNSEAKIAALGIRVRKWVTYHGICINVNPDLSHYSGIVPCGISEFGVTSLQAMDTPTTMAELDAALKKHIPF